MVFVFENSWRAKVAARVLKGSNMAITFGNKIFLYNTSRQTFLQNKKWVRHELKHVEQYHRLGFFKFIALYLWYSIKHGYHLNPLEVEARLAEADEEILDRHKIAEYLV